VPTVDEQKEWAQVVEECCEVMHDAYEKAAAGAGWETNPASRKPWADVPEPNKVTMRAAVETLLLFMSGSAKLAVASNMPITKAVHMAYEAMVTFAPKRAPMMEGTGFQMPLAAQFPKQTYPFSGMYKDAPDGLP